MSILFCAILYRRERFDPKVVLDILGDADAVDEREALVRFSITGDVEGLLYVPPDQGSRSDSWDYGREWFEEQLSGQLAGRIYGAEGPAREVVLYAHDDMNGRFHAWRITRDVDERRFISDGEGCRERLLPSGEMDELYGATLADPSLGEEEALAEQQRLEEPFAAEPLLEATLGVGLSELLTALAEAREGDRLWP